MKHGGARVGAGRPATQLDMRRVMVRITRGDTQQAIADDFGVSQATICYQVKKNKQIYATRPGSGAITKGNL